MPDTYQPIADLTAALIARLRASTVPSVATGGVWGSLKANQPMPAVRVIVRGKPTGPINASSIWECEAEIDIYAAAEGDPKALAIAEVIVGLLNQTALVLAGWRVIVMAVLDLLDIADEFLDGQPVKRRQIPVKLDVVAA